MSMNANGISNVNTFYHAQFGRKGVNNTTDQTEEKSVEVTGSEQGSQIDIEEKINKANEFLAQHDALYAEQTREVMETITDGMRVAQEIARRMSSGAKVSQADENNLQQYDPRMYQAAKSAQLLAQRKKDMSHESLIDKFVERHKNDRKDWTSELNDKITAIQQGEEGNLNHTESAEVRVQISENTVSSAVGSSSKMEGSMVQGSLDISV